MRLPGSPKLLPALLLATLTITLAAPPAGAAMTTLHIDDPEGDAEHREFGWEEPTLDVTEVRFNWTDDGTLQVSVLLPNADTLGPEGTMDPFPGHWTVVDVYWTMNGSDYLARAQFESQEPTFLAGQGIRIHRQVFWEEGTDVHGETTEQSGHVESVGDGHRIVIEVDPAAVGSPAPGALLEAPAFSTWIDHHTPLGEDWPVPHPVGPHHPANADINDEPGIHFHVPGEDAEAATAPASAAGGDTVPGVGVVGLLAVLGAAAVLRRR